MDDDANAELSRRKVDAAIHVGLVALLAAWCIYIAAPFIAPVVWGGIIAIGSYPLYLWLKRRTGLGDGLTATVYTLALLALLITPTVLLTGSLVDQGAAISEKLKAGELQLPPPPDRLADLPLVGKKASEFWASVAEDPKETLGAMEPQLRKAGRWLVGVAAGAGRDILMFVFSIIIAGVFLANAEGCRQAADAVFTRLLAKRGVAMTRLARTTVTAVVNGVLGLAVAQTLLAGLGFMVMGIPAAGVLALICLVLAVVQIDILIILIPVSIYGFSEFGTLPAILFLAWNIGVGLMNNVLKPILLGRGVQAPMAVIFVGAIGGLIAHGIIGLFVGAVVFVLGYTLFVDWVAQNSDEAAAARETAP